MSNEIHSTAVIEGDVVLGANNKIGPYCVLIGPLKIGDDNLISPHVCIGTPGEDTRDPRYDSTESQILIGDRNIIREFTAIQKPCYRDATYIGNDTFLMHGAHIPHDAILEDKVVVTPLAVIGGVVTLMEGATVGMGATVHQYSVVGQYSMVATNAAVLKNVRPFSRYIPGKPTSVNTYQIEKQGLEAHRAEIEAYVLRNEPPTAPRILEMVHRYEALHEASGRRQYE